MARWMPVPVIPAQAGIYEKQQMGDFPYMLLYAPVSALAVSHAGD